MIALIVTLQIKPEHRVAFMDSLLDDARGANEDEPGCLRFDVLQDDSDPNRVHLYEVYRDDAALDAHRQAPHYIRWRDTVQDWFDGEVLRQVCTPVYSSDDAWR